jgi:leucyl aminopeptidase (aminopeptidase T)
LTRKKYFPGTETGTNRERMVKHYMISEKAVKAVFEGSLKLRPSETCLIVTDTIKKDIGEAFYKHARKITRKVKMIAIEPTSEHGAEPPFDVAETMMSYDVQILVTDRSLTHTRARREATRRGARIATMPSITEDIANRCLDIDYKSLKKESERIYEILRTASTVRVSAPAGTDITFKVGKGEFFGRNGGSFDFPGAYGNLPEGEVAFAPAGGDGVFVVDMSFADHGLLTSPLSFRVSGGVVKDITGENSDMLIKRLDRVGARAYKVAELGIGLNPKAIVTGNILEDEKVIGTVHIAVGNNVTFGGDNDVPIHLDGVISAPDIFVDGVMLMEKGRFVG